MSRADFEAVQQLMTAYFDGLYRADSAALRPLFHPSLTYVSAGAGDDFTLDLEAYMARIDQREPPAMRGEKNNGAVLEIGFGGERMARVTARMAMMGRDYLDFLTLVRDVGGAPGWRIAAKIFTYDAHAREA
ncbi:nuclear transport factor 2 family protein [Sphingopyxis sp. MWB1]|uniref:nuclear transport factor 2 family protein n=1 Tax=Sphingopyxis sp. MWB1 TaxID=1537715 RepID=UPI00051A09EF|nr:nuclear transport factor 2 family protein [Sphingopyxis sp. MWB1]